MGKKPPKPAEPPPIQVRLGFSSRFKEDLAWWDKTDPAKVNKIFDLVKGMIQDFCGGIGKPEPLKYLRADLWSRRIDLEHRLVYRVSKTQFDFIQLSQEERQQAR